MAITAFCGESIEPGNMGAARLPHPVYFPQVNKGGLRGVAAAGTLR